MWRCYWRLFIEDRPESMRQYEIYLGEFVGNRLTFGTLIPHGVS